MRTESPTSQKRDVGHPFYCWVEESGSLSANAHVSRKSAANMGHPDYAAAGEKQIPPLCCGMTS